MSDKEKTEESIDTILQVPNANLVRSVEKNKSSDEKMFMSL